MDSVPQNYRGTGAKIDHENGWLENSFPFGSAYFSGAISVLGSVDDIL